MKKHLYSYNDSLLVEINNRRNILLELASIKGLADNETIEYSQGLDCLIFLYQENIRNPRQSYHYLYF